jgi:hypothetical protein
MPMRPEIEEFVDAGPLPSEEDPVERIAAAQEMLGRIPKPVSDEEGRALATCFGPDDCYGLAWSLLHLIETAPGALTAEYPRGGGVWVDRLRARVDNARGRPS